MSLDRENISYGCDICYKCGNKNVGGIKVTYTTVEDGDTEYFYLTKAECLQCGAIRRFTIKHEADN